MERDIDMRQTIEEAAKEYLSQLPWEEGDKLAYHICEFDFKAGFKSGAEWERAEAINAHWKSCPKLSKDNDRMCNHSFDCNQNCEYMRSFIRLLRGIVLTEPSWEGS